jgi:hypothetical protein
LFEVFASGCFRMVGWRGAAGFVFEGADRRDFVLRCSAVLAVLTYWYPWYLATYHASEDDRYVFVFPLYCIGAAMSAIGFYRLMKAVVRGKCGIADVAFAVCGGLLAAVGFSSLTMFG